MESPVAGMEASSWSPTTRMSPLANPPPSSDLAPPWGPVAALEGPWINVWSIFCGGSWELNGGLANKHGAFHGIMSCYSSPKEVEQHRMRWTSWKAETFWKQNAVLSLFFWVWVAIYYYCILWCWWHKFSTFRVGLSRDMTWEVFGHWFCLD